MSARSSANDGVAEVLQPGARVGNYRLLRLLGRGGMGAVYEAVHLYIERRAAIKVLHAQLSQNSEFRTRFLNEARAVNLIQHPGLVEVYEFGLLDDGTAYIVMEFLQGESLEARIKRSPHGLGAPALKIATDIAQAMVAAHQKGIVHRDLKPGNVMLLGGEVGGRVKVLDFGIAKMSQESEGSLRTETGAMIGTPAYMAPEQCVAAPSVDGKADVYALGIMLYEMLSGQLPFRAKHGFDFMAAHVRSEPQPLGELLPDLPPEIANLVHSMLVKEPALRPSMDAVAGLLQELQGAALSLWSAATGSTGEIGAAATTEAGVAATISGASLRPPRHSKEMIEISATAPGAGGARLSRELAIISGAGSAGGGAAQVSGSARISQSPAAAATPSAVSGRGLAAEGGVVSPVGPSAPAGATLPGELASKVGSPSRLRPALGLGGLGLLLMLLLVVGLRRTTGPTEGRSSVPQVRSVKWVLTSQPSGAEVLRSDGQVLGNTPFSLVRPADVGESQLTLRLPGYAAKSVVLSHNADVQTAILLSPLPAAPTAAPSTQPDSPPSGNSVGLAGAERDGSKRRGKGEKGRGKAAKGGGKDEVKLLMD